MCNVFHSHGLALLCGDILSQHIDFVLLRTNRTPNFSTRDRKARMAPAKLQQLDGQHQFGREAVTSSVCGVPSKRTSKRTAGVQSGGSDAKRVCSERTSRSDRLLLNSPAAGSINALIRAEQRARVYIPTIAWIAKQPQLLKVRFESLERRIRTVSKPYLMQGDEEKKREEPTAETIQSESERNWKSIEWMRAMRQLSCESSQVQRWAVVELLARFDLVETP